MAIALNCWSILLLPLLFSLGFAELITDSYCNEKYGFGIDRATQTCKFAIAITTCKDDPEDDPMLTCPGNSTCSMGYERKICRCNPGFTRSFDLQTCDPGRHHGEECDDKENLCLAEENTRCVYDWDKSGHWCQCSSYDLWNNMSLCIPKQCEYRYQNAYLDWGTGACILKVGPPFNEDLRKLPLSKDGAKKQILSCPTDAEWFKAANDENSENLSCKCKNGFIPSKDRKSCLEKTSVGVSCSETNFCPAEQGLLCGNGVCECNGTWSSANSFCFSDTSCEYQTQGSFFEKESGECRKRIRADCKAEGSVCPINAKCTRDDDAYTGFECKCYEPEFVPKANGNGCNALKRYGEECSAEEGNPCDGKAYLKCLANGRCGCPPNTMWDAARGRCELEVGQDCSKGTPCSRNSECPGRSSRYLQYCRCLEGYTVERDPFQGNMQVCRANYLNTCDMELDNDCRQGTACIDGTCKCKSPMNQIYQDGACQTLVGGNCTGAGECISRANCSPFGVCQCTGANHVGVDRICYPIFGDACHAGKPCDFNQGMACIGGLCKCFDPFLKFDGPFGCVAVDGARCGTQVEPVQECRGPKENCKFYSVGCEYNSTCVNKGHFDSCQSGSQGSNVANTLNTIK